MKTYLKNPTSEKIILKDTPAYWGDKIKTLNDLKRAIYYNKRDKSVILNLSYEYKIGIEELNTLPKLLWWIRHLIKKPWMTLEALDLFIDVVCKKIK